MQFIFFQMDTLLKYEVGVYGVGQCGMRNPSTSRKDDDLSRLTTTSSSSSSSDRSSAIFIPNSDFLTTEFISSYLPEVIDPLEWQISRKRKERQDSTSSITQDRKLIRSNSEEYLPTTDIEVIRRVSSHGEIKNPLTDITACENVQHSTVDKPIGQKSDVEELIDGKTCNNEVQEILRQVHQRTETSPARSRTFDYSYKYRLSPNRESRLGAPGNGKCYDETDSENEGRRNSERFCRARAPPIRKSTSSKKTAKYNSNTINNNLKPIAGGSTTTKRLSPNKLNETDENSFKYDIATLKYEKRGFASKKPSTPQPDKLIDKDIGTKLSADTIEYHQNDNNSDITASKSPKMKTSNETLPWERSYPDDTMPVISQRFSDHNFDYAYNFSCDNSNLNHIDSIDSLNKSALGREDMMQRDNMMIIQMPSMFDSPDDKLKQINKRLTALKKRVSSFEEVFEREHGYRPSHSEKLNDRYMKNAIAEMHKLRKEKQQLKTDPMAALGYKPSQSGGNKVQKMKETIVEIEKRLTLKRDEEKRPSDLDDLTAEQLIQEKTSVQRGLLYLESLFGRPNTREERDVARPLYDRYRIIKRLVNRTASLSASGIGVTDLLPTILEHEAMVFTAATPPTEHTPPFGLPVIDSPSDLSSSLLSTESTDTSSSVNENIHTLSIEELWKHLDAAREEKKQLRRQIKEFEDVFEEQNGRKMLKSDRTIIENTYALYKQKKAKLRLLDALVKKHMTN